MILNEYGAISYMGDVWTDGWNQKFTVDQGHDYLI